MFKRTFVFCTLLLSLIIFTSIFQENNIKFNNTTSGYTNRSLLDCNGPDTVYFTIQDSLRINNAKLFSSKNFNPWDSSVMVKIGNSRWSGILMLTGAATYRYYVKTVNSLGNIGTMPAGAPTVFYSLICTEPDTETVKPVITHTPLGNAPKSLWPVVVTANVTDNSGIDSVWVRWRKNNGSISRQFRLSGHYGYNYSDEFNSIQSEVNIGDTIFYRIIAQDNSPNHNRDSTALYSFRIISQTTALVFIGTGTVPMGSTSGPYNTYWYGNKTQFLWLTSEILANQGSAGYITGIGFQISVVGGQAMNGLYVCLQNTTNTSISGFTYTGWTNVFGCGIYTVPGTGWQYVEFWTPYYWNGTSNLLVEICFGNTSYTTATTVLGTSVTGMEFTEFHDISTCNTFQSPTAQTARANVCFVIDGLTGVNPSSKTVPTTYSLSQNFPNPFNPVTRINFDIAKSGMVNLKIYDVLGREVKTLVNEFKSTGSYSVDFDASDFSSGVYFYKIGVNEFSDIKRMILIK